MLEIFFPLCAADPIRWQRHTPDVEHGIWPDVADERLQQWLQTDAIRLYIAPVKLLLMPFLVNRNCFQVLIQCA